ncbi:putative late blight resistance protein homolog r1b-16 [Phtheirospermum japonicum]|uniref:Putative late blight resistance protein homolog r1b-16 n=1 Tax=Phtheirospermum japonicum TaxID=374723 RepID=A0A830DB47_9LAMI|nr:putative late blight resistance protein homolog r1b-16 [Phtheirospermum japonicum]
MDFLDADQSAQLLESKLLPKERYPPELNGIGRQIAVKCQGLPLAIVVVAGILNNIDMTSESWKKIIESVESVDFEYPEHCMNILALSYNYLPAYLKACFLYVGAFPRDGEIRVTRLTWLWIAEGLVLPVCGRLLEDVAEDYLEDLVNRNLIIVGKRRSNGRIKTCRVHDLLRDLCLREAHKEKFLCEVKDYTPTFLMKAIAPRRISLHSNILKSFSMYSMPLARTFLCYDMNQNLPDMFLLEAIDQMDFKLMRVLDIEPLRSNHLPVEILELIHLRFLALAVNCELPRSILKLQNLQTLIVDHIWEEQYLPWEIWRMTRLRHIRLKRGCNFPHPCRSNVEDEGPLVLENLQTLSNIIGPVSCSKEVFVRFPSLKKLGIVATESSTSSGFLGNLIWLNKLETLRCSFLYRHQNRLPSGHNFLVNLSKLTLVDSYLPWEDMSILALLPRLEVLKLLSFAFEGGKWIGVEGGFVKLKLLVVQNSDPSTWDADGSHFPKLEKLILRECHNLKWIPEGIGDIVTLKGIEVHDCSFCVMQSAWDIRYLQQELGNDEFFVRITLGGKYESDLPDYFVSSIKSLP